MSGQISIHALLAESDGGSVAGSWRRGIFLSTLSLRRATLRASAFTDCAAYFYPRSPCGERQNPLKLAQTSLIISIHALLAESDFARCGRVQVVYYFYPRSPCGERLLGRGEVVRRMSFLSTLSLRRATNGRPETRRYDAISIHALLAESDFANFDGFFWWVISIHALLAESDGVHYDNYNLHCVISIHALLAESDQPPRFLLS